MFVSRIINSYRTNCIGRNKFIKINYQYRIVNNNLQLNFKRFFFLLLNEWFIFYSYLNYKLSTVVTILVYTNDKFPIQLLIRYSIVYKAQIVLCYNHHSSRTNATLSKTYLHKI